MMMIVMVMMMIMVTTGKIFKLNLDIQMILVGFVYIFHFFSFLLTREKATN